MTSELRLKPADQHGDQTNLLFFGVGMGVFNDDAAIDVVGKHLV